MRPLVGWALDRYGRRPFFLGGILSYLIAQMIFFLTGDVMALYLARMAQGLGSSLLWLSAYAMAADLAHGEERGVRLGGIDEAWARGALYGAIIGMPMLVMTRLIIGWKIIFAGYTVLAAYALWQARSRLIETYRSKESTPLEGRSDIPGQFLSLMGIVFLTGISSAMVSPLLIIFLQDKFSTDVGTMAMAFIPAALIYSFLPSRMGRISDRIGRKLPMIMGLLGGSLASLLLPNLGNILYLALLWAVEATCLTAAMPAQEALVADLVGHGSRGTAYGLYTFTAGLGAAAGPLIGGWLYDAWSPACPFYLNAVVLLLGACLVALLIKDGHGTVRNRLDLLHK